MKYLTTQPVTTLALMFGAITATALILWPEFRPEIQSTLRTAQELLFWWQQ
jgi:hypothetical protein